MGHYEDLFWEISDDIRKKGLKKEFDAQLAKMRNQDKHRHSETRDRWAYAHAKVTKLYDKKAKK